MSQQMSYARIYDNNTYNLTLLDKIESRLFWNVQFWNILILSGKVCISTLNL